MQKWKYKPVTAVLQYSKKTAVVELWDHITLTTHFEFSLQQTYCWYTHCLQKTTFCAPNNLLSSNQSKVVCFKIDGAITNQKSINTPLFGLDGALIGISVYDANGSLIWSWSYLIFIE